MADPITSLKQRIDELEEINRLAESLGGASNIDEILGKIIEAALKLCKARRVAILLFSPSAKEVVQTLVRSSTGTEGGIDHKLNLIIAGWIESHEKPLLASDVLRALDLRNPAEEWRALGPVLAMPLISAGKIIGVLNLLNQAGGREFTQESLRLGTTIATFAAQFISRARLHERLFQDNERLKNVLLRRHGGRQIIGNSEAMREVLQKIDALAASDITVLLTGETGTGKELVARAIHFHGPRMDKPFVAVNCSAIPASLFESELFGHERGAFTGASGPQTGKFELAHEGTLLLDEVSEMPLDLQPKLLRILEERSFYRLGSSTEFFADVRIIATTSKDLRRAIDEGKFREDLYHRISVAPINLPPLRERIDDIPVLAEYYLKEFSRETKNLTQDALASLTKHSWKGNIRELKNVMERASLFIASHEITARDLATLHLQAPVSHDDSLHTNLLDLIRTRPTAEDLLLYVDKSLVGLALKEANGNISQAARLLGLTRSSLARLMEKFRL